MSNVLRDSCKYPKLSLSRKEKKHLSQKYHELQNGTLFAKITQVFTKLWPICRFVSKFSIISAASPRASNPKIVEKCNHTTQASAHQACAEDGYIKCPHLPIIDGDIKFARSLVVGWILGRRTPDTQCT